MCERTAQRGGSHCELISAKKKTKKKQEKTTPV